MRQESNRLMRGGACDNAQIPRLEVSLPNFSPENCVGL